MAVSVILYSKENDLLPMCHRDVRIGLSGRDGQRSVIS